MNRDKLQQQLDEMKVKIAEMELELTECNKFELDYVYDSTYLVGTHKVHIKQAGDHPEHFSDGRYRQTKEAAELSLARNRRANRLEALIEQVGGIKEFVKDTKNYSLHYSEGSGWGHNSFRNVSSPEQVYMNRITAVRVCEILNANEYTL